MGSMTIPAGRKFSISPNADGSVVIDGVETSDMPQTEPENVGTVVTYQVKNRASFDVRPHKRVAIKANKQNGGNWRMASTKGSPDRGTTWQKIIEDATPGTLRVFPSNDCDNDGWIAEKKTVGKQSMEELAATYTPAELAGAYTKSQTRQSTVIAPGGSLTTSDPYKNF